MPTAHKGQKYGSLKKEWLKKGELFTDNEFQPNNKSLFYSKVDNDIVWKRPKELCKVPKLIVEGVTCEDLVQGDLGNTWFVASCSSITQDEKLWQKVIPNYKEQDFVSESGYCGIFHFNFWRYGDWIDVVVDDLLPTKNGELVFCHSKSRNEFWSALLEKAYAKLYGDYESLNGGSTADSLVDFTGGVAQKLFLEEINDEETEDLFTSLLDAFYEHSLMNCDIRCDRDDIGSDAEQGLVKGYNYGITAVKEIKVSKGLKSAIGRDLLRLIRLRNPWTNKEWTGAWSDSSEEWKKLSAGEREKLGITFNDEGEFWMEFDDFLSHFTNIDICHFVNTSFFSLKKSWYEALMPGEWTQGVRGTDKDRCGGCDERDTFLNNPQYVFDIKDETDNIMVSLEQNDLRVDRKSGGDHLKIGFHIMKVEENRKFRVHKRGEKMHSSEYKKSRSIYSKIQLDRGRYVIIPSTFEPGLSGGYLLRVYTGKIANSRELVKDCPVSSMCARGPAIVMTVNIIGADGLDKKPGQTCPYAEIECEGETVKTCVVRDSVDPKWGTKAIFYRKKPDIPIRVEIFNSKMIKDEFMGQCSFSDKGNEEGVTKEYELFGRSKKEKKLNVQYPGMLSIKIHSSTDLTEL